MATRKAIVRGKAWSDTPLKTSVETYLPRGFKVTEIGTDEQGDYVIIEGVEHAGWTLDNYVIPRLATGLLYATRVA